MGITLFVKCIAVEYIYFTFKYFFVIVLSIEKHTLI